MHKDEAVEINEEALPGIGLRDDFVTIRNRRVGVIAYRDGHRDLLIYAKGDPDSCSETVMLTAAEADTLAELLGTHRVVERLANIAQQVESIETARIEVNSGSTLIGNTLGQASIRPQTGASIVAVWRGNEVVVSPLPDFKIEAGDCFIAVGTAEALVTAAALINSR